MGSAELPKMLDAKPFWRFPQTPDGTKRIDGIMESVARPKKNFSNVRRLSALTELLCTLLEEADTPKAEINVDAATGKILRYIQKEYRNQITLDRIASEVNISKYYLCRLFKKHTGMSVSEYIMHYRITEVKKQLISTDEPIMQIAEANGFKTYTYFSALFKHLEAVSPAVYRKKMREASECRL